MASAVVIVLLSDVALAAINPLLEPVVALLLVTFGLAVARLAAVETVAFELVAPPWNLLPLLSWCG